MPTSSQEALLYVAPNWLPCLATLGSTAFTAVPNKGLPGDTPLPAVPRRVPSLIGVGSTKPKESFQLIHTQQAL